MARLSGLLVLAAIIALVVAALPAFGTHVPKEPVPLGGEPNDCSTLAALEDPGPPVTNPYAHLASPPLEDYRIENPVTGTFTDPATGAQFTLNVTGGGGKELDWSTAQLVHGVVIKGGSKSVVYDYFTHVPGPTSSDVDLVGPDKNNPRQTFNISHVTFCYELVTATVSGTKWHDHDQNGEFGGSDPEDAVESGLGGWTINLYEDDVLVDSTTTAADGTYSFAERLFLGTLTVCEVAPSGQWAQSDPGAATWQTSACGNGSEEPDGHVITTAGLAIADFGNFVTTQAGCGITVTVGGHTITFPVAGPLCDKETEEYVLESYVRVDGTQVHDFHPLDGATTGTGAKVTEVHVWSIDQIQNSTKLFYNDDGGPVDREAQYCNHDPTDGAGNLVPALVPPNMTVLPGTHTTCIITSLESADGTRTDFLYSEIDGRRFV